MAAESHAPFSSRIERSDNEFGGPELRVYTPSTSREALRKDPQRIPVVIHTGS